MSDAQATVGRRPLSGLIHLLALALGAWLLWLVLLFVMQRSMMFPGTARPAPDFAEVAPPHAEQLWVSAGEGRSEAWFLPGEGEGPRPAILFYHGNFELIDDWPPAFAPVQALGLHVVLAEYPGYGRSTGKPGRAAIGAASIELYDRIVARPDVAGERIIGWGRSLGGGAVADLAGQRPLAGLLLESSFSSVHALARGYLAPPFLLRDPFDNVAALRRYEGPVLITHGRHDGIIPPAHAEALAAAAPQARLVWRECGHNDCDPLAPEQQQAVRTFLQRFLATPAAAS